MDSLSQALLGASTFALVKDKYIGKKSLIIGAIAGTIPDLDVFLAPFFNEVAFITVHRSVSHSLIFAVITSFFLAFGAHKITRYKYNYKDWALAFFLAIFTHSLLDWCTTYGTKILSPFNGHLFSLNNIHIIEPIYTSILLIGVLWLFIKKTIPVAKRTQIAKKTLIYSTLYLGWTFVSKGIANQHFIAQIQEQNIEYKKMIISPTPLNSLLWNAIIKTNKGYYFGSYSLLDRRDKIEFFFVESSNELLPKIKAFKRGRQYLEFTQDFPLVQVKEGKINVYAIKFGPMNYFGEPEFVYPLSLSLNESDDRNLQIDHSSKQRGPIKNYRSLFKRIKGI
ncbi:metal-dependent hydrolase [Aureispira anguillae]|uniref:Metal-dependent hydrolase n=1 Tax=Aureispira anguillae TaxID=2864201 RepID=A0A915YDT7_9BACT|nr:metal-dependent hydrolase [Aureispira anguillae]BDS11227.1 metal-dependent hydrolase [Aureispira anguillae]